MRDKHLHIAQDSELLKFIYQQVDEKLIIEKRSFVFKIWMKFIFYFSFSALCYSLLYTVDNPFYFVLSFILYGFVSLLFVFNFSHDFSHNTIFKSKKTNNLCFIFIYTIVGAHAEAWKQRHINSHHYAPNVEGYDSDLKITKLIRVIPNSEYSKDEFGTKKDLKYHLSFWIQKTFYITFIFVLLLAFSSQVWYIVLIGFLLMHLSQSLILLFTFFMTHHVEETEYPTTNENGYINTSWLMNQIKSSNDMHPFSETANFILGGFNNHIAHHLFPHYHHIHYPKLNKILYEILLTNNIKPNQTTYLGGLLSHLKLLKRMSYADKKKPYTMSLPNDELPNFQKHVHST